MFSTQVKSRCMVMLTNTLAMAKTHSNFWLSKIWFPYPPAQIDLLICMCFIHHMIQSIKILSTISFHILLSFNNTNSPCQFFFSLWSLDKVKFLIIRIITSTSKDEILVLNTQHHPLLPYGPSTTHKANGVILSILWRCFNALYFRRTKLHMNISTTKDWVSIYV
jgi:hypothetical protein